MDGPPDRQMEGELDEPLPLCCGGMTALCQSSWNIRLTCRWGLGAAGYLIDFGDTCVGSMGHPLGSHGDLESWSDLRFLDLTFNFLNRQQKHQGQGPRLHAVLLPEVSFTEGF